MRDHRFWQANRNAALGWVTLLAAVAAAAWVMVGPLPYYTTGEALAAGEDVTIQPGGRDRWFFADGWAPPFVDGQFAFRLSDGARPEVWIPLGRPGEYGATLRLDPYPLPSAASSAPLPQVIVLLNGTLLGKLQLQWTEGRIGSYPLVLPESVVRPGSNRLSLVITGGVGQGRIRLQHVRVRAPLAR